MAASLRPVLCAVGDLLEDAVVLLSGAPNLGSDVDACITRHRGGSAANVAAHAAALHVPAYSLVVEPLAGTACRLVELAHGRGIRVTVDASSAAVLEAYGVDRFRALLAQLRPAVLFASRDEARATRTTGAGTAPALRRCPVGRGRPRAVGGRHVDCGPSPHRRSSCA